MPILRFWMSHGRSWFTQYKQSAMPASGGFVAILPDHRHPQTNTKINCAWDTSDTYLCFSITSQISRIQSLAFSAAPPGQDPIPPGQWDPKAPADESRRFQEDSRWTRFWANSLSARNRPARLSAKIPQDIASLGSCLRFSSLPPSHSRTCLVRLILCWSR